MSKTDFVDDTLDFLGPPMTPEEHQVKQEELTLALDQIDNEATEYMFEHDCDYYQAVMEVVGA